MLFLASFLLATATAAPPDFSHDPNLTLLAPTSRRVETSVAASGGKVLIAAIKDTAPGSIDVFVSSDGALTWSAPRHMAMSAGGITYTAAYDPCLAVLDDGSFGLVYLATSQDQSNQTFPIGAMALLFTRSTDGVTWSPPVAIVSGTTTFEAVADRPWLSIDHVRGIVYLVWTRWVQRSAPGLDHLVVMSTSTDHGATWSAPVMPLSSTNESFGQIAPLSNGTLVLVSFDADARTYLSRVSTDGGSTFGNAQTLADGVIFGPTPHSKTSSPAMPMLRAFRNDVYCVYPANSSVFFRRSRDSGATWSEPLQLGGASGDAVLPAIALNESSGDLIVTWLDGRDDPGGDTLRLYAARSTDGGGSFSTRAFSSSFAAGGQIGDFNGAASIASGFAVAAFATEGGYLTAARVLFAPLARRRAAGH